MTRSTDYYSTFAIGVNSIFAWHIKVHQKSGLRIFISRIGGTSFAETLAHGLYEKAKYNDKKKQLMFLRYILSASTQNKIS